MLASAILIGDCQLNPFQKDLKQPLHAHDHQRGRLDAPVKIVAYLDFASPATIQAHQSLTQLQAQFPNSILLVYRHFPQSAKNPQAFAVSQALEAAGKQGKFWEMVEIFLDNQAQLSDGVLRQYARMVELDLAQFEDDFSEVASIKRIKDDIDAVKADTMREAPVFFVNGSQQQTLSAKFIAELISDDGQVLD